MAVFNPVEIERSADSLLTNWSQVRIVLNEEDGRNGMKAQLNTLCQRFNAFEKKAIRVIAVGASLPGVIVAVVAVLKFFGKL